MPVSSVYHTSVTLPMIHSLTSHGSVHLQTAYILIWWCDPGRNTQALSRQGGNQTHSHHYNATANKTLPLLRMDSWSNCSPRPLELLEEGIQFLYPRLTAQKTGQLHALMLQVLSNTLLLHPTSVKQTMNATSVLPLAKVTSPSSVALSSDQEEAHRQLHSFRTRREVQGGVLASG